ncbi:MAG: arylsulfatase A-like enzyme [Alphaproteobacteria bacterium]|jgi:arylsulfatase A-like enzyme
MRKALYILLCSHVMLTVACGGGAATSPSPTPTVTTTPTPTPSPKPSTSPNILLIISDDQGLDASAQYSLSTDLPNTPNLTALANQGLVFDNAWATPACTTTRATLITGKYGVNTGVTFVPAQLTNEHQLLQDYIEQQAPTANYQSAVFGKWHLGGANAQASHPNDLGVDYYAGNIGNISDYNNWQITVNGVTTISTEYHTTHITNLASEWINQQTTPWFAWVAYAAPHSPFHLPPTLLHNRTLTGSRADINNNRRDYYLAAIEAMDAEIGRLVNSLDTSVRDNTLIVFIGDNGTPARVIDTSSYNSAHAKGSLYQGGIAIPMFVSGNGVTRAGQREAGLVTATDLFATIAEVAGANTNQVHDSYSFADSFSDAQATTSPYIFTQFESASTTGVAARNANYKVIEYTDGTRELFSLANDFEELNDQISDASLNADLSKELNALLQFVGNITGISNFDPIDISNAILTKQDDNCASYMAAYTATAKDVARDLVFIGDLTVEVSNDKCIFTTNAIPNHDFNDGGNAFANNVSEQNDVFEITTMPSKASITTELSLRVDNAILLNGVKVDLIAAGCFGVGDGNIGCNDMTTPWRFDPMHPANNFRVDTHNAHAQPDGTYHYHGSPFALFADDNSQASPVIGFAADGYPIYGSYINSTAINETNGIRKVSSSYRLKEGQRTHEDGSIAAPGGQYDGAFRDDYEYIEGLGDLDECNGMVVNGQYAYYITNDYPYVLACFSGTPDSSFNK